MNKSVVAAVMSGLVFGAGSVQAEEDMGVGVGARVSTLGYGFELSKPLNKSFTARVGFNNYSDSETETQDDINYKMDLDWQTIGLFADWHPFQSGFRLTLGYINNDNEIDLTAVPVGTTLTVNNTPYNLAGSSVTGNVAFDDGIFYGLGYSTAGKGKGFGFTFEAGILQQDPSVKLAATGPVTALPGFASDLEAERAQAESDIDDFDSYPVIALGISYSF